MNIKLIYLTIFLLVYILYINNIYLSYKLYNNYEFNNYDKMMVKITSTTQSIIFLLILIYIILNYDYIKNLYNAMKDKLNNNILYLMILFIIYYGYSMIISFKLYNKKYDLNNLNDNKNKDLRYHINLTLLYFLIILYYNINNMLKLN